VRDLATLALFGSAAAATALLWPVIGRDPARFAQLLSDVCQRGPELWGHARAKSPPEIINTLQGCVQPDRISQLPLPSTHIPRAHTGLLARAIAVLMVVPAQRSAVFGLAARPAPRTSPVASGPLPCIWMAHGRSPPSLAT
jgi:hypothetical protein